MSDALVSDLRAAQSFEAAWAALGRHGALRRFAAIDQLLEGCRLLELLGYHHRDLGFFISVISGCGLAIPILARDESKRALLHEVAAGERIAAVAITERGAGSDALGLATTLRRHEGRLVLRGAKWSITNAPVAHAAIVFCWDESGPQRALRALVLPTDIAGVEVPPAQRLIGCHGSPTGELRFHDVTIDPAWLIAIDGKSLLDLAFVRERLLAPWPLLGKMAREIQNALDYVAERQAFGKPIASYQYVQDKIVSSYERLEASRHFARAAVEELMAGRPAHARASLAKYYATDSGVVMFKTLLEVYGSHGLVADAPLGQYLADALCATVAGGTREMHKRVIFDQLLLDRSRARRSGRSSLFNLTCVAEENTA